MELLAPWSLVGLVLVPAVFLWGLLAPRGRRIVVGSLLLWKRALGGGPAGKPSPRVRLKDPLLWLDALLVLLLVVALAQPAVRTAAPLEPVASLVVDRTASMYMECEGGGNIRWHEAHARVSAILKAVGDAPIRLVSVPDASGSVLARDMRIADLLFHYGPAMEPVLASGDVWPVALAEAARQSDFPVLVATDAAPTADLPADVYVVATGAASRNAGLRRVAARVESEKWWLLVAARASDSVMGACGLEVRSDGKRIADVPEFLRPGQEVERILAMEGRPPPRLRVTLQGPGDGFLPDDSAFLVRESGGEVRVLLVGAPDAALRRALAARESTLVLEAPVFSGAPPTETDLVIAYASLLPAEWKGPAALVLPPEGAGPVRPTDQEAPAEWRVAVDHPLADALYLEPPRLGPVRRYTLDASAELLLGTPDVPLIVTWEAGGVRRLAVLFALDESATDWPTRAGFPVFWRRALDWLVPVDRRPAAYRTYRPLDPMPGRTGRKASARAGFFSDEVGDYGVSFIGSDEPFQSGPARDDSKAAVEAIRRSIEAHRRATFVDLWPYLAAAAVVALLARAWAAK